jgi:hypothetical protein
LHADALKINLDDFLIFPRNERREGREDEMPQHSKRGQIFCRREGREDQRTAGGREKRADHSRRE